MMAQAVALLMTVVCLFGTALGLRFKVYVLIPAGIAVLIVSAMAELMWQKMAGLGIAGTLALLIVLIIALNVGFAFGLLLRAGAVFQSTRKTARLFARTVHVDQSTRRPERAEREASSEGAGRVGSLEPTVTMSSGDLAKEGFRQ
jgi:hypothetical protein